MPDCNRFFVYGTLRIGTHDLRRHGYFWPDITISHEPARLRGYELYRFPPSIRPAADDWTGRELPSVLGDLFTIREEAVADLMPRLDRLETYHPERGYVRWVRAVLPVHTANGHAAAWVYLGGPGFPYDPEDLIPDGDWIRASHRRTERPKSNA